MEYQKSVIDSHYHIYGWYNQENREFWDTTEEYCKGRNFRSINLNALPSVEWDVSNNIIVALYKLRHPDIYAHGGLIYDTYPVPAVMTKGMDPLQQYRELMEIGFDGVKMLETKPTELKVVGRPICDALFEGYLAAAEEDGTHLVWHVADPLPFWDPVNPPPGCVENGWFYGDGTFPSKEEIYRQVLTVLDRHPRLNVTFAHFFFMSDEIQRLEEIFEKYPNVNVDLTPGTEMYDSFGKDPAFFQDFFTRRADRVEFGTDTCDGCTGTAKWNIADTVYRFLSTDEAFDAWGYRVKGMKLENAALEKILKGNFLRRVGEQPKSINPTALKAYIAKYRHLIQDGHIQANIDAEAAKL